MNRDSRSRRWPAISAAVGVLVLASVGTAIAASGPATTSVSIVKVSKTATKALRKANKALRKASVAVRIARNTSKQQGPKGDTGPRGAAGPQGPPGVSGLQIVEAATAENSEDTKEEEVSCPPGKRVFGGGASVEGPGFPFVAIDLNSPASSTSWAAAAHEHDPTASNWELIVYAICGNAS